LTPKSGNRQKPQRGKNAKCSQLKEVTDKNVCPSE
jgi:hypothetical protein